MVIFLSILFWPGECFPKPKQKSIPIKPKRCGCPVGRTTRLDYASRIKYTVYNTLLLIHLKRPDVHLKAVKVELRAIKTTWVSAPVFTCVTQGKLMSLNILIYQRRHNNTYHAYAKGLFGGSAVLRLPWRTNQMEGVFIVHFTFSKMNVTHPSLNLSS